jgi:hypothetical protein
MVMMVMDDGMLSFEEGEEGERRRQRIYFD